MLCGLLVLATSCNRKVALATTKKTMVQDSSTKTIDTTTITLKKSIKTTTYFGDTLKTKTFIGIKKYADSGNKLIGINLFPFAFESNGLTINGKFIEAENGYNLDLETIAKPKETTTESTTESKEQKGITNEVNKHIEIKEKDKAKQIETDSVVDDMIMWMCIAVLLVLLVILVYYLNKKAKW